MRNLMAIGMLIAAAVAPPLSARAQSADDPYTIMRREPGTRQPKPSEPWLAPKYKSPRGTKQHAHLPRVREPGVQAYPPTPPPISPSNSIFSDTGVPCPLNCSSTY